MPSAFFLAQTAVEIRQKLPTAAKRAWMACHFSPYGTGLSNLPQDLPEGSMVIVNDLMPVASHDPERIAAQLTGLVQEQHISHVLLDFQRPGESNTAQIAKAIVEALPCPVGVSQMYADGFECPVFLPPPPLHTPLKDYIESWKGRPVWLELMPDCVTYTITEKGCGKAACKAAGAFPHFDEPACCRYRTEVSADAIQFTLMRGQAELERLRNQKEIECFVGLFQEFAQSEAQATALDQWERRSMRSASEI